MEMTFKDEVGRLSPASGVNRRRLHGSVAHEIAIQIIGGSLQPGEVLPNEDDLSAALMVSRTAYREGIRTLVAKGLVSARPKVGTSVNERSEWNILDGDVLAWYFEVAPDPDFIRSLFELRRIVEPAAAALAAQRYTPEAAEAMSAALVAMQVDHESTQSSLEADLAFHLAILTATDNEALLALFNVIEATIRWSVRLKMTAYPTIYETTVPSHAVILDAILARDEQASSKAMRLVIDEALGATLDALTHQAAGAPRRF
jgi:DNA-binding FadR family transcriptional regulator